MPKPITWYEITVPQAQAALDFYSAVFGYATSSMDMGEMGPYTMLHSPNGGGPFAGVMPMTGPEWDGIPPHWMTYFYVSDINSAMEKIKESGGKVLHGPMTVPDVGEIAVCHDDQGAHFSIHQPSSGPEPEGETDMSKVASYWVELMSPSREKTNAFYQKALGWGMMEQDMGPKVGFYTMFTMNDYPFAGSMTVSDMGESAFWMPYLATPDIAAAMEKTKSLGGSVLFGPENVPDVGQIAMCKDNSGAVFGLHQPV